jgi:uncharacterized protein YjiK
LVISERTGAVHALRLREDGKDVAADAPKLVGTVAPISEADDKGFEGIAVWVAKGARPARVVVVNEGKPRRVLLLSTSTLALEATLPLPDGVKDELEDLSDVVVTPAGDELLILSQKSRRLAWFRVDGDKLVATATATLSIDKKEKPEAVAFDDDGTLLIGTDKSGKLYRFRVEP